MLVRGCGSGGVVGLGGVWRGWGGFLVRGDVPESGFDFVGFCLGGPGVGLYVGDAEGSNVGIGVGFAEGSGLGRNVGSYDGVAVGKGVGMYVGDGVGYRVG